MSHAYMGNMHTNKWIWWDLWERTVWIDEPTGEFWTDAVGKNAGNSESLSQIDVQRP
jgi:hypothetical protein